MSLLVIRFFGQARGQWMILAVGLFVVSHCVALFACAGLRSSVGGSIDMIRVQLGPSPMVHPYLRGQLLFACMRVRLYCSQLEKCVRSS